MEAGKGKVWHKFAEEKPTENKDYAVLKKSGRLLTLRFFPESGVFNWDGIDDYNTTIEVEYWAELQDIVESARL